MNEKVVRKGLRVLWPTDGSAGAAAVAPVLDRFGPNVGRLRVLTVAPHRLFGGCRPDAAFLAHLSAAGHRQALDYAREVAIEQALRLHEVAGCVEPRSLWGNPIEVILEEQRRFEPDLIIMGSEGCSAVRSLLLGSVSHGIIQHGTTPVLIVRPRHENLQRIIVGYEGSALSRQILQFLTQLPLDPGTQITLVRVVEPYVIPAGTPATYRQRVTADAREITANLCIRAEESLVQAKASLISAGFSVETEPLTGRPANRLLNAAITSNADLVVVGSRKPSPRRQFLLSSTAEHLVRHSTASVLVVR